MTGYDWENISRDFDINRDIYNSIKDKTDEFIISYHDSAKWKAGWGHDFHCDYCSAALAFNIQRSESYICPVCGKENRGDRKDWAWTYMYRSTSCVYVKYAGILYNITKSTAISTI